jgi:hypothetical protein
MSRNGNDCMIHNGLGCVINMPLSTKSKRDARGEEVASGLAPFAPTKVYRVDAFPNAPAYMKRSDLAKNLVTYFFPYTLGHMAWFDLRMNLANPYDVAAFVSAQRRNAIDGRHIGEFEHLMQYGNFCPDHNIPFITVDGNNKHCSECGYAHAPQNYIANTTVQQEKLWIDGWRDSGRTREFTFTENEAHGVAASMGDTDRVNAFGISLYLSKKPKPPRYQYRMPYPSFSFGSLEDQAAPDNMMSKGLIARGADFASAEIGAGALVDQEVGRDPNRLDHWSAKPSAILVAYYVSQAEFESIVPREEREAGNSGRSGFLMGKVGNDE